MPATVARFEPLQPLTAKCFGCVGAIDGNGVLFLLLKDDTHHWGLWERTASGITPLVVPLPGGKNEGDATLIPLDGKIIIYFASRLENEARPAHECEVSVPHARRAPGMAHVSAIYQEIKNVRIALTARVEALERALANLGQDDAPTALEGRVGALEGRLERAGEAMRADG